MNETSEAPIKKDRNLRRQLTDIAHRAELAMDAINAEDGIGVVEAANAIGALRVAVAAIEQAKGDLFPAKR